MDRNTSLAYPYFNKLFKIHTNDRDFQLGLVISQEGKPIALCGMQIICPKKGIRQHKSNC